METYTLSPEFAEKLDKAIEKAMATLGATSYAWFFLYILVSFIDRISPNLF